VIPRRRSRYDVFVDSSGWYALANRHDPYHAAAERFVAAGPARLHLFTTNLVVAECHALFLSRRGRQEALRFLSGALRGDIAIERITPGDELQTLAILERYSDKDFSYTDASSFAIMARFGVTVALTADRNFLQYGYRQAGA
jgi:predicted nucleic acid-binding protein